jgi:predicted Zn finger-like uncharacterized protein
MIAACPKCDAKYRVDEAKIGAEGARLRCAKCQAVFRVRAPAAAAPVAPPEPETRVVESDTGTLTQPAPAPSAPTAPAASTSTKAPTSEAPAEYDSERLVLIADPREDSGKQTASTLNGWGLQTILVHDGVEAMMSIQRAMPRIVILDAALPKMYGFQVCEIVKRNESLSHMKVILVGAIHMQERYRRPPTDLYGADVYLEQPDLPDGLAPLLRQYGLPLRADVAPPPSPTQAEASPTLEMEMPAPAAPQAPPKPAAAPQPTPAPSAPPAADDGLAEEREKADRLARIVVSDIVLYQGEKFEQAIASGNLAQALDAEIEEGRGFFRQRVSEAVRNEKDHLMEELMRVARQRGMQ